ncbi:MAG: DUF2312 domain-containing protein [Proteobacteria bacterium]|nr:DUF2312 domain-containing protein [Pseudomonadota bacterium]MBT7731351.1 DUF2312 domain-containing protein [Rhodospirillaceae bacterium]
MISPIELKKVMAIRIWNSQEVLEEDAVLDLYKEALGM